GNPPRLRVAIGWDLPVERADVDLARGLVLEPAQDPARDPEARGDDAAGVARVHARGEDVHSEGAAGDAAEGGGAPELVGVAAAGVEAHDEARLADPRRQRLDVRRQIDAAALLAGLDQEDAASALHRLVAEHVER